MSLTPFVPVQGSSDFQTGSFGSGWAPEPEPGWGGYLFGNLGGGPFGVNSSLNENTFDLTSGGSTYSTSSTSDERGSFEARLEVRLYLLTPVGCRVIYHFEETPMEGGDPTDGADQTLDLWPGAEVVFEVPVTENVYTRMVVTRVIAHPWC